MDIIEFVSMLVENLVSEPDLVKVKDFETGEGKIIEVLVSENDISKLVGKNGNIIKSLKTIINVKAYELGLDNVRINFDSF